MSGLISRASAMPSTESPSLRPATCSTSDEVIGNRWACGNRERSCLPQFVPLSQPGSLLSPRVAA